LAPGKKVALELLREAYRDAFEKQCQQIWAIAPDGVLYDPASTTGRFTVGRCLGDLDPGFGENEESVAAAADAGTRDANDVATVLSSSKRLCAAGGTPCWPA